MAKTFLLLVLAAALLAATPARAQEARSRPVFTDPGNRVLTVESWASTAGYATAWAVYPDKVVTFSRNDFGDPERVLADNPLGPSELKNIRDAVAALPAEIRGKLLSKKGLFDGSFLCVSFAPDSSRSKDRIELENVYTPAVLPLFTAINAALSKGPTITYSEKFEAKSIRDLETVTTDVHVP